MYYLCAKFHQIMVASIRDRRFFSLLDWAEQKKTGAGSGNPTQRPQL